jgi:hypothetical protein
MNTIPSNMKIVFTEIRPALKNREVKMGINGDK